MWSPGRTGSQRPIGMALGGILAGLLVAACDTAQQRVESHLARAERLAVTDAPGPTAAVLELRNALAIEPDRADIYFRIAEILREHGDLSEAISYYEEALFLEPGRTDAAIQLARLLSQRKPDRAQELVAVILAANPTHAAALAARAQFETESGALDDALASAQRSVEFDPELSAGQWALGKILVSRILEDQGAGKPVADDRYEAVLRALDRYAELSAHRDPWSALPERARLFGIWPGHQAEAQEAWRAILAETSRPSVPDHIAQRAVSLALEAARKWKHTAFRLEALERLTELEPENLAHWDELASLREILEGTGEATLLALLESRPDDPEVYLRYASYVHAVEGRDVAIRYLEKNAENEALRPEMLGALIELREQAGEETAAAETLATLQEEFPFHPYTLLVESRQAMKRGDVDRASALLRRVVEIRTNPEDAALLAHAESSRRDYPATLDAIARAIEIDPRQRERLLPLRAHAYSQSGQCERAVQPFARLYVSQELNDHQKRLFAQCLYEIGDPEKGREVLVHAISRRDASVETLLELARREQADPKNPSRLRRWLEQAVEIQPGNIQLAVQLSAFDRLLGDDAAARERVGAAYEGGSRDPELRMLRARQLAESGNHAAARVELEELFRKQPHLPGILPQLLATLVTLEDRKALLLALKRGERFDLLGPKRYFVYGNLLMEEGDRPEALRVYERALALGYREPPLLVQLALLLVEKEEELERAEYLVRAALSPSGNDPEVLDTLGIVLLRSARFGEAAEIFEQALAANAERGGPPRAATLYRLGLALEAGGDVEAARQHFSRAHALDPSLPAGPGDASKLDADGLELNSGS